MTQTEIEIPAADVTADVLRSHDLDTLVVVYPSGKKLGGSGAMGTLTFGLGSHEGDYEGFAEWLRTRS